MFMNKRVIKKITTISCVLATIALIIIALAKTDDCISLYAHGAQLNVDYDTCIPNYYQNSNNIGDGEEEKWYEFNSGNQTYHIGDCTEIKYFIYDTSEDGNTTWNNINDPIRREYVKNSLINSILKWNNVFLYKTSNTGFVTKYKLVNISEGTISNHNISIYPDNSINALATCGPKSTSTWEYIDTFQGINHYHFDKWNINFKIAPHYSYSIESEHILNRTGAHEFGHVMGMCDIDGCENTSNQNYHHEEILMGYAQNNYLLPRQAEITYKDLIGTAITRGLHTDADHSWIYDYTSSSEGNRKLICSICNGVRYVDSLVGYDYVTYKGCNNSHTLSSGKMFPVASYGNKDYYKCKYCRYVAPFTSLVDQDYLVTSHYNSTHHIVTNQVNGLSYSCLEEHTFDADGVCTGCSQTASHSFDDHYVYYTSNTHKAFCTCGTYILKMHAIDGTRTYTFHGHLYGPCIDCGAIIDLGINGPIIPVPNSINQMVTDNGSFIMDSGIYFIVEEDLEAYLNGSLIFHPYGELEV